MVKKILLALLILFVLIQFFGIDTELPASDPSADFITVAQPHSEVTALLQDACYDCHSFKSEYPWYSQVAPLSWWIQDHILEGREHLNFSEWTSYSASRADHKLEEIIEMVEEEEMPLPSFTWAHPEARLSNEQRKQLIDWFTNYRAVMADSVSASSPDD